MANDEISLTSSATGKEIAIPSTSTDPSKDIAYLRQEQLSISGYYTKLKGLWDELASYNDAVHGTQQEQQKLMQFLMGLNDSYSAVRGQILLMNPLPSVRQAYSSVSQKEK
ncbi:hypothetical protein JRO89_XS07G0154500 [Xanthoceras sorbifolium]|uniref:Uncharacterized protein n=1 Tax=Xanthoceras sorbifolium TaxID=99658 RepID=A0ABQ8HTZ5_9ROSI|nr:hypothetical protein JRO89_XS07G0154500 [Xanthoceras sorbifolium]